MNAGTVGVIGLMSGTSLDGIDVAYMETDGENFVAAGPALTLPYDEGFRDRLRAILGGSASAAEIGGVERDLTLLHVAAVKTLLEQNTSLTRPALIGFHGHTILHRPQEHRTWQIGDGALLASSLDIQVIYDFRSADVAAGGQGAPLVPIFHRALAGALEKPVAVLNIGGVANVTWIGERENEIRAFDTGPGNALIDDWVLRHTGKPFDENGALASTGQVDIGIVQRFLSHPFYSSPPPKSLDRDDFAHLLPHHLSPADGAATLTAVTAASVARARDHFPKRVSRWLVTGGGRHNPTLMAALRDRLEADVVSVEAVGWDGDALEAQAFAYLAVRSLRGLPSSFPGTTGVRDPQTGGRAVGGL